MECVDGCNDERRIEAHLDHKTCVVTTSQLSEGHAAVAAKPDRPRARIFMHSDRRAHINLVTISFHQI
jgi:hypothetical protein